MPRRPSFRRDTELQNEVRRVNKLVQNKQSRIRVSTGLETDVETVKYKEFNSRKEINEYLKEMDRFLDRKANFTVYNEKGLGFDYMEDVVPVEKKHKNVNKQKQEQWDKYKDLDFLHNGVPSGLTVSQQADPKIGMGDPRFADFRPVKFNWQSFESYGDFLRRKKKILERYDDDWLTKINEEYKRRYLKGIHQQLGWDGRHLYEHVSNMPLDEFMRYYHTSNNTHIGFLYDQVERLAKIQELSKVWDLVA